MYPNPTAKELKAPSEVVMSMSRAVPSMMTRFADVLAFEGSEHENETMAFICDGKMGSDYREKLRVIRKGLCAEKRSPGEAAEFLLEAIEPSVLCWILTALYFPNRMTDLIMRLEKFSREETARLETIKAQKTEETPDDASGTNFTH